MRFFFDRNLPVRLARILDIFDAEHQVIHQDDDRRFASTDQDTYIIETLSQENPKPVFVSADVNIYTRRANERQALRGSGLTCVFLKKGFSNLPFREQTLKLVRLWSEIAKQTSRCRQPTTFEVTPAAVKLNRYALTRDL